MHCIECRDNRNTQTARKETTKLLLIYGWVAAIIVFRLRVQLMHEHVIGRIDPGQEGHKLWHAHLHIRTQHSSSL
jgi:hypothetical protein